MSTKHSDLFIFTDIEYQLPFNETGDMKDVKSKVFTTNKTELDKNYGDIVRIEQSKPNVPLALCEVEVYGGIGIIYIDFYF